MTSAPLFVHLLEEESYAHRRCEGSRREQGHDTHASKRERARERTRESEREREQEGERALERERERERGRERERARERAREREGEREMHACHPSVSLCEPESCDSNK